MISPGLMARVVWETDTVIGCTDEYCFMRAAIRLDLPAPLGDETMNRLAGNCIVF